MKKLVKLLAVCAVLSVPMFMSGVNTASANGIMATNEDELIDLVHATNRGWDWEPRCGGGAEWDWNERRCEGGTGDHHNNHHNHHGNHHGHHNHHD